MNRRNRYTAIAASFGMLVLILDGKTALSGAAEGVRLCLHVLIPSLFPYFVLSILLTGALTGQAVPILRPAAKICGIPKGAESLLAIGMLGGYPVGAQNTALMHEQGRLSEKDAARMIAFCNNAGPAFIFGILGPMFSNAATPWLLWAIHIISAIAVGILLPGKTESAPLQVQKKPLHLTDAMVISLRAIATVCGWVILMRMVLEFMDVWFLWFFPQPVQISLCGILELSNGCIRLANVQDEGLRFLIAAALLSLGGVCVTLQTVSVTAGISKRFYFPGKLLQCCISIILTAALYPHIPHVIPLVAAGVGIGCVAALRIYKNSSGIPEMVGV